MQPQPARRIAGDRYNYMAEVVLPIAWESDRFLLGEAIAHRACAVSGDISPTYRGFLTRHTHDGVAEFYEIVEPVTLAEWEPLTVDRIVVVA